MCRRFCRNRPKFDAEIAAAKRFRHEALLKPIPTHLSRHHVDRRYPNEAFPSLVGLLFYPQP